MHLIRASLRYASRKYWVPLSKDLRPIYTAPDQAAAAAALENFAAAWEQRYPAIVKVWRAHWVEFTPFLAFPPEVRRCGLSRQRTTQHDVAPGGLRDPRQLQVFSPRQLWPPSGTVGVGPQHLRRPAADQDGQARIATNALG